MTQPSEVAPTLPRRSDSAGEAVTAWSQRPLLDGDHIAELSDAIGAARLERLLARAPTILRDDVAPLQQLWQAGDLERMRNLAHRLSGNAETLGAKRLGAISTWLSHAPPSAAAGAALAALERICHETIAALEALKEVPAAGSGREKEPT